MNNDQITVELKKIKKKWWYCFIPVVLGFITTVATKITGASFDAINLVFFPGGCLSWALMSYRVISTKCPKCDERFYTLWLLIGFGNVKRIHSCCNCKLSLPINKILKPYPESTGDEWNQ